MKVKFIKGTFHLGYAYRAGDGANLPDEVAKKFIEGKYAIPQEERKEREPIVEKTVISRAKKRTVK